MSLSDYRYSTCKHDSSLRCLQSCTEWRLEVLRSTEGEPQREFLGDFFNPSVSYKRCTDEDKVDLVDMLV